MSTRDRRTKTRQRVMLGAEASVDGKATKMNCVVRNASEDGARIDMGGTLPLPENFDLTIASKRRSYKAKVVWSQGRSTGIAFVSDAPSILPDTELEERLKRSERQTRRLKQRVRELSGG